MNQTISAHQFEAAYDTYSGAVFRLAMVYLGQQADAEDVTQETFLRLLYRAPIFADQTHEKRWLLQVPGPAPGLLAQTNHRAGGHSPRRRPRGAGRP